MVIILSQYYPFQTDTKAQKKKSLLHWKDMENIQKKMNLRTSPILDY